MGNLLHGHSWNYGMLESVTHTILPDFYSLSGSAGYFSGSVNYIPSTNELVISPGGGTKSLPPASLTAGWTINGSATDYVTGFSGGGCGFYIVGGCGGVSPSSKTGAVQFGFGTPQIGVAGSYGFSLPEYTPSASLSQTFTEEDDPHDWGYMGPQ